MDGEQGMATTRGRKSLPWRRDPGILARLRDVERRHLAGDPNTTIAEALGVGEVTIRRDLERLRELWLEQTKAEQADLRAQVVAELDDVKRRALAAAEFDEQAERAVLYGEGDQPVQRDDKGTVTFRGQKAQALNVARQAVMDKAKVLGVVVEKSEVTGEVLVRQYVGIVVEEV